ncbi:LytTR family transcriptional regulator DNA-binding domain-containing protein [Prolixibacteraceae bacterium Z1-6]|uniref:LytTR family transcriptional regulator DNA-binding domain-containing protein n=1 Tax=Draconibacterium aestuarii TaxID=2998507 RepID=A0A9X3F269_9BACT|nr:LytTR family transcriptional regulator DNA-binding domain-containing protein [Prolixibacteraceae bacterium Z1-6]
MRSKISNPFYHILFWLVVTTILILVFGRSWNNNLHAFYFISLLLPVVMATSYFFNYYLVPYFLLKKRYFLFGLYFFYMLVLSLYLQMIVVFFSYIYFANFNLEEIPVNIIDQIILLDFVMYAVVFAGSFFVMIQQLAERQKELEQYKIEQEKRKHQVLELVSNRQQVHIPYESIIYIESLADYIKVHTSKKEEITSKEKISSLEERLPDSFVRIHRSFIVNTSTITRFSSTEIEVDGISLNIGRSYKSRVLSRLQVPEKSN